MTSSPTEHDFHRMEEGKVPYYQTSVTPPVFSPLATLTFQQQPTAPPAPPNLQASLIKSSETSKRISHYEGYPNEEEEFHNDEDDDEEDEADDCCCCFSKNDTSCKTLAMKCLLAFLGLFGVGGILTVFFAMMNN